MITTTLSELRSRAKHYLDLVEAGETVRVFRNGKAVADLAPVPPELPSWKQRQAQPVRVKGVEIARMIIEDRGR
jgi:antitoxin (DNA-binding transcriptional repressor) of toxin-antitoxin stability system